MKYRYLFLLFLLFILCTMLFAQQKSEKNDTKKSRKTKLKTVIPEKEKKDYDKAAVDLVKKEIKEAGKVEDKKTADAKKKEKEAADKESKKEEKKKKKRRYKIIRSLRLNPKECNTYSRKRGLRVIPVTDVFYKYMGKRGLWIPVGWDLGIQKGQKMIICRDIGENHYMPVSNIEVAEIWKDGSFAQPLKKFEADKNDGSGIRIGDVILFEEIIKERKIALFKPKRKKKKKKVPKKEPVCPPVGYNRDLYPEFREDLLHYESEIIEEIEAEEKEKKQKTDKKKQNKKIKKSDSAVKT